MRQHRQRGVLILQSQLGYLDVPVTELPPDEVVHLALGLAEMEILHQMIHTGDHAVHPAQYPAILQRQPVTQRLIRDFTINIAQYEPRRVPQLVGEVAGGLNLIHAQTDVVPRRGAGREGVSQGISAVLVDQLQRVQHVALHLAHLFAAFVSYQPVQIDGVERYITRVLQAHHNHPRHPEEEDIVARLHDRRGVEIAQFVGLIRPPQRRVGPQRRAEPGIEDVRVLLQFRRAALGAGGRIVDADDYLITILAVPHRDAVPPPQLAADAPVPDILQPVEVHLGEALGDYLDAAIGHRVDSRYRQRGYLDEPLLADPRLDGGAAAAAVAYGVLVRFDLHQQPFALQAGDKLLTADIAVGLIIGAGVLVHRPVGVEDIDRRQAVRLTNLEVHRVVRRRYLNRTGAEGRVDGIVGDYRYLPADDGQYRRLAHQCSMSLILRVNRHRRIT